MSTIINTPAAVELAMRLAQNEAMLQPYFDWAKKPYLGSGEFKTVYQVYATLTIHTSQDGPASYSDVVWYGHGQVVVATEGGHEVLKGTLAGTNNVAKSAVPQDLFPPTDMQFIVTISKTASVTAQWAINGKNFLGRGPDVFQGICEAGLVTAVVANKSYTLSFSNYTSKP